jgi:hypothetical protein
MVFPVVNLGDISMFVRVNGLNKILETMSEYRESHKSGRSQHRNKDEHFIIIMTCNVRITVVLTEFYSFCIHFKLS